MSELLDAQGIDESDLRENRAGRLSERQKQASLARIRSIRWIAMFGVGVGIVFAVAGAVISATSAGNWAPAIAGIAGGLIFAVMYGFVLGKLVLGPMRESVERGAVTAVEGTLDRTWGSGGRGFVVWVDGRAHRGGSPALGRALRRAKGTRVRLFVTESPRQLVLAAEPL